MYWRALGGLALAHVLLVWLLPVLPAQDLPQHLAFVRILADYDHADLAFRAHYVLAEPFQSHFVTYYALARLARVLSAGGAVRVALTLYVLGVFAGLHALVITCNRGAEAARAADERADPSAAAPPPWTALLGVLCVWSPVMCMGFLAFALAVPLFLFGAALFAGWAESQRRARDLWAVALVTAALTSVHVVAAGAFVLFCALYALATPARRRAAAAGTVLAAVLATLALWSLTGALGLGDFKRVDLDDLVRRAQGPEFVDQLLRVGWNGTTMKLAYTVWTMLGPWRAGGLLVVLGIAAAASVFVWRARREQPPATEAPARRPLRRAAVAFAAAAWLLPWSLYVPSEITFLELRTMTLAFAVLLATIDPRRFVPRPATVALVGFAALVTGHFGGRAAAFALEAKDALALLEQARPPGTMLPLVFDGRSAHFAKLFRVTHFLPMYYTVRQGGLSTQFWGRYTPHLPVDYRPGTRPAHTPDWVPWEFKPTDLAGSQYLLVQAAGPDTPARERGAAASLSMLIAGRTERIDCRGAWCLYRVR